MSARAEATPHYVKEYYRYRLLLLFDEKMPANAVLNGESWGLLLYAAFTNYMILFGVRLRRRRDN